MQCGRRLAVGSADVAQGAKSFLELFVEYRLTRDEQRGMVQHGFLERADELAPKYPTRLREALPLRRVGHEVEQLELVCCLIGGEISDKLALRRDETIHFVTIQVEISNPAGGRASATLTRRWPQAAALKMRGTLDSEQVENRR